MLPGFSPTGCTPTKNRRDTLKFEWPLAHCCHLIVFI
jgi:hypothetical protein